MAGEDDDEDCGPAWSYGPDGSSPLPVIAIQPFPARVESRRDETIWPARVVAIRQVSARSAEFDFIAITEEDGALYCEAFNRVLAPEPDG